MPISFARTGGSLACVTKLCWMLRSLVPGSVGPMRQSLTFQTSRPATDSGW